LHAPHLTCAVGSAGLGTASAMARIGGFAAPFVSDVLFDASREAALIVFAAFAIGTAFVALELPETAGGALPDAVGSAQKAATTDLGARMRAMTGDGDADDEAMLGALRLSSMEGDGWMNREGPTVRA
jgi:hypothetical protein